jgi:hypothetical protein
MAVFNKTLTKVNESLGKALGFTPGALVRNSMIKKGAFEGVENTIREGLKKTVETNEAKQNALNDLFNTFQKEASEGSKDAFRNMIFGGFKIYKDNMNDEARELFKGAGLKLAEPYLEQIAVDTAVGAVAGGAIGGISTAIKNDKLEEKDKKSVIGGVMKGAFMGGTLMNGISSAGAMMDAGKRLSKYGNDKFMQSSFKQAYDDFINEPNIFDTTYKDITYAGFICGPQLEQA